MNSFPYLIYERQRQLRCNAPKKSSSLQGQHTFSKQHCPAALTRSKATWFFNAGLSKNIDTRLFSWLSDYQRLTGLYFKWGQLFFLVYGPKNLGRLILWWVGGWGGGGCGLGVEIQYVIDFSMSLSLIRVILGDPGAVSWAVSTLENGNNKAINSSASVRTRGWSPLFSSNINSLLSSIWATWYNREKVKGCEVYFSTMFSWTLPFSDRKVPNSEIKIHVYAKRQTWICTTWPSFSYIRIT